MMDEKRYYDCVACEDKNCSICPNCGKNPQMRDTTDEYRKSVKTGYYSSGIISYRDKDGVLRYGYAKPGE
ncbi:MAG: hypothetical protein J6J36_05395 [Clostridia bacterium]|nr:hypothetical protein [Clostridia bacterium]